MITRSPVSLYFRRNTLSHVIGTAIRYHSFLLYNKGLKGIFLKKMNWMSFGMVIASHIYVAFMNVKKIL